MGESLLPKRFYRSRTQCMIAGVCGGIAEFFHLDPTWIRLLFVLALFFGGSSILVYGVLWFIVPKHPDVLRIAKSDQ